MKTIVLEAKLYKIFDEARDARKPDEPVRCLGFVLCNCAPDGRTQVFPTTLDIRVFGEEAQELSFDRKIRITIEDVK